MGGELIRPAIEVLRNLPHTVQKFGEGEERSVELQSAAFLGAQYRVQ
jgi:hypothetical protein